MTINFHISYSPFSWNLTIMFMIGLFEKFVYPYSKTTVSDGPTFPLKIYTKSFFVIFVVPVLEE